MFMGPAEKEEQRQHSRGSSCLFVETLWNICCENEFLSTHRTKPKLQPFRCIAATSHFVSGPKSRRVKPLRRTVLVGWCWLIGIDAFRDRDSYIWYTHIARGLTFARNPPNSMRDCNLLCCFHAFFAHCEHANIDISCVSPYFCVYLRRCQNHLLKRILQISSVICSVSSR